MKKKKKKKKKNVAYTQKFTAEKSHTHKKKKIKQCQQTTVK